MFYLRGLNNKKHYAAAITAFLIWGFFSLPLRALKEFSAGEILYFRILFSCGILISIISLFMRAKFREDVNTLRTLDRKSLHSAIALTLTGGALLTVNWLTFIYIVNNINIKTASFSYLICPVITAALGYVLIKEKMTTVQWIAVFLCAISCILIGISSALELGFSFLTALTYALYLISQRKLQGFNRMVILAVQITMAFLVLSIFFTSLVAEVPQSPRFYMIIALIAVLFTILPLFLNLFALNRINSATIGILMYINPLINFSLAFVVFHEALDPIQFVGYAIIAVALLIFNFQNLGRLRALATK